MRRGSIFVFILLSGFLFYSSLAHATSGACSWHNGVNCSVGPDLDGSVICNDGWRDSSVSFSQMSECKGAVHSCTTEQYNQLSQKYNIDQEFQEIQKMTEQLEVLKDKTMNTTNSSELRILASESLALSARISARQENLRLSMNLLDRDCYALGEDRYYKEQADFYSSLLENKNPSCVENAYFDASSGTCKCNSGYGAVGSQCVQLDTACKANYGGRAQSIPGTGQCTCSNGNVWNDSKTSCISGLGWCKSKIGGDVIFNQITQRCECSSGYEFNGSSCVKTVKNTEQVIPKQPAIETNTQLPQNSEEKLENKYIPIEGLTVTSSDTTPSLKIPAVEKKQGNFIQRVFQKVVGWFKFLRK